MSNFYKSPQSQLGKTEYANLQIVALSGRIGRLRFLVYSFFLGLLGLAAEQVLSNLLPFDLLLMDSAVDWSVGGVTLIGALILTIRRLQDVEHHPLLCLIMFLPIINLLFWLYLLLAPGSEFANSYGLPPPPNPPGMGWLAALAILCTAGVFLLFFGSIFALLMFFTAGSW
ncbi:DUF805 domain-containing protein [Massilia sp. W12]|uniref:DUF805 domain-containing protein n=1 Tax=Massilia sp. W12 TaxID=3126507 RepID=UPI0030D028D8